MQIDLIQLRNMLLNAYEWNEDIYYIIYLYRLYILHIFVCKFSKRRRCWPQAAGWRNRKHAERRKPNGCPDTSLLSCAPLEWPGLPSALPPL